VTGQPPPVSDETKAALLGKSEQDTAQSAPGKDGGDKGGEKKVKTEKELQKERAKAEKLKKFQEKQQKQAATAPAAKAAKEKKPKVEAEVLPPYTEKTPVGSKKVLESLDSPYTKAYIPAVVESAWGEWWEKEGSGFSTERIKIEPRLSLPS